MITPGNNDDLLLVEAYCDGELDAGATLAVERRLATEPRLKAHQARVMALRTAIAGAGLRVRAGDDDVRQRILSATRDPAGDPPKTPPPAFGNRTVDAGVVHLARPPQRRYALTQMAAAITAAAVIASGTTALVMGRAVPSSDIAAVIAGHQRALLAASPFDVASSDRHTLKPWFDAKLAVSPRVPDLSADGFQLAGGRVDIVGGRPVPTLVYLRREHLISVTAVPKSGAQDAASAEIHQARDGFAAESWSGRGFAYTAVSDISEAELEAFCDAWRKSAAL